MIEPPVPELLEAFNSIPGVPDIQFDPAIGLFVALGAAIGLILVGILQMGGSGEAEPAVETARPVAQPPGAPAPPTAPRPGAQAPPPDPFAKTPPPPPDPFAEDAASASAANPSAGRLSGREPWPGAGHAPPRTVESQSMPAPVKPAGPCAGCVARLCCTACSRSSSTSCWWRSRSTEPFICASTTAFRRATKS